MALPPLYLQVYLQPFVMKPQLSIEGKIRRRHLPLSSPGCKRSQPVKQKGE